MLYEDAKIGDLVRYIGEDIEVPMEHLKTPEKTVIRTGDVFRYIEESMWPSGSFILFDDRLITGRVQVIPEVLEAYLEAERRASSESL